MFSMRPKPVYLIGDSQTLVFSDRVFLAGSTSYVVRTLYFSLEAGRLAEADGEFAEPFAIALRGSRLIVPVGDHVEAFHASGDPHVWSLAQAEDRPRADPPLVFSCGALDAARLARQMPQHDLVLPDEVLAGPGVAPECLTNDDDAMPAWDALTFAHLNLEGFRIGMRRLRSMGFGRIAVLSLAPLTTDDAVWFVMRHAAGLPDHPRRTGIRMRYKLLLLYNFVLRVLCAEEGITFIDRWNDQTVDGIVRPGVLADGVHISGDTAEKTLRAIVRWIEPGVPEPLAARTNGARH